MIYRDVNFTMKQTAIMKIVVEGNKDEKGNFSPVDLDQIIERVFYHPSKDALHFSIRKLINKGMIYKSGLELRRDRERALISPTKEAIEIFSSKMKEESYVGSDLELEEI